MNFRALFLPRLWRTLLALLLLVVSVLALTPSSDHGVDLGWDKLNHISAFVALAFSAWLGFDTAPLRQRWSMPLLLAYGGAIELLQLYVPGRSCEWGDLAADALGIVLGVGLARWALQYVPRNRTH